jgi:hypothetical protein
MQKSNLLVLNSSVKYLHINQLSHSSELDSSALLFVLKGKGKTLGTSTIFFKLIIAPGHYFSAMPRLWFFNDFFFLLSSFNELNLLSTLVLGLLIRQGV